MRKKEIVGLRFGRLLAIHQLPSLFGGIRGRACLCECDCGLSAVVSNASLAGGHTSSCGCIKKHKLQEIRTTGMMTCITCKNQKLISEFHKNKGKSPGISYQCKLCRKPEARESHLVYKFKKNKEWYEATLESQGSACAICGSVSPKGNQKTLMSFCVDHDHETGKVRGLLCHPCNTAIGSLGDSTERLRLAITYLEKHKCEPSTTKTTETTK
jgi:hypothetical protein